MDPAIGPVADETLENQKHVRETEGKCGGWNVHAHWKNRA
jgi:hypothetical protein